jgi:hypothetical protein
LVAHRKLAGVHDLYTARAAIRQQAPAGCRVGAHRKLAGVHDLYTARAAIRQPDLHCTGRHPATLIFSIFRIQENIISKIF